jgi:hypothetical protein
MDSQSYPTPRNLKKKVGLYALLGFIASMEGKFKFREYETKIK